ncbi:MAG: hypothetical protein ACJ77A_05160 [Actinomycetota bacterium]
MIIWALVAAALVGGGLSFWLQVKTTYQQRDRAIAAEGRAVRDEASLNATRGRLSTAVDSLSTARGTVAETQVRVSDLNQRISTLGAQIDSLESSVRVAQHAADSAYSRALRTVKSRLANREAAVAQRERDVTQREQAVKAEQGAIDHNSFGDGTYRIGSEVSAGTYRASGGSGCYWERLSGFGGGMNDIIANGGFSPHVVVTIQASDAGFSSSDCGTWVPLG